MVTKLVERPTMARRSNDASAKIDAEALRLAKLAAEIAGLTLAEYVSRVVAEQASRDLDAWAVARVDQAKKTKAGPK